MALTGDPAILVPVDVSADDMPGSEILDLLRPVDVVVLGYWPVPRQTAPAHLRDEHGEAASARLERIVAEFDGADHHVAETLVFTRDRQDSIDRVADQYDCDAVLVPGETAAVDRLLVPLRGDVNLDRIVSLVGELVRATDAEVTLFHAVAEGADPSQGEFVLRGAADRLAEDGVDRDRVDWILSEGGAPADEIVDLAPAYDLLVVGETEPSLRDRIIGAVLTPVLEAIESPALIVRDPE